MKVCQRQILEEGKGTDEVENFEGGGSQTEGSDCGRESEERGGEGLVICPTTIFQVQVHEVMKGAGPIGHIRVRGGDDLRIANGETARVVSRGV